MSPIQDTKRSHSKKNAAPSKKRTVPLPLEIVFRPDVRGTYDPRKAKQVDEAGETYNPLKDSFTPTAVQFEFKPDKEATRPWVLPEVEDPWLMREEILWESEDERLDAITGFYGRWGVSRDDLLVPSTKVPSEFDASTASDLLMDEYMEWRSLIRAAMTTKMSAWPTLKAKFPAVKVNILCEPMALSIEWRSGWPAGIIKCSGILRALIATLQIDALMDAEYRFCACVGCGKSFKVMRRDQRYCPDSDCKHRQVVRNGRERQRKAEQQRKSRHTERKSK